MLGERSDQRGLWEADRLYLDHVGKDTFYGLLASMRGRLFRDADFAEFYCADNGRDSVPPSLLATALLLQAHDKVSDAEAKARADFDIRWKVALGIEVEDRPFAKSTLQVFRAQLILHDKVREVFESSLRLARESGYLKRRSMKVALDTTNILGRGAVKDTYNLLADGIIKLMRALAAVEKTTIREWAKARGYERYLASSIKGEAAIDWSDKRAPTSPPEIKSIQERRNSYTVRDQAVDDYWQRIYNALANDPDSTVATIPATLWPHQERFRQQNVGSDAVRRLIADEVGLGKTLQAGIILKTRLNQGKARRALIISPKAATKQWQSELLMKFAIDAPVIDSHGYYYRDGRTEPGNSPPWSTPLAIAGHQWLVRNAEDFLSTCGEYDVVIVDEAHRARFRDVDHEQRRQPNQFLRLLSQLSRRTRELLLLTATPMQLNEVELWALLELLEPEGWQAAEYRRFYKDGSPDLAEWKYRRDLWRKTNPTETGDFLLASDNDDYIASQLNDPDTLQATLETMRLISPAKRLMSRHTRELLRRYRRQGLLDAPVPQRQARDVVITMTPSERVLYDDIKELVGQCYVGRGMTPQSLGFITTIFRKRFGSSTHAYAQTLRNAANRIPQDADDWMTLLDDADLDELTDRETNALNNAANLNAMLKAADEAERLSQQDSKRGRLTGVIAELREQGHNQILLFTQFRDTQSWLSEHLQGTGHYVTELYGQDGHLGDRGRRLEEFQQQGQGILLCTETASESLNLQFCSAVVNHDIPWNPMTLEQRAGRIDRIGQERSVVDVINLFYEDTAEHDAYKAVERRFKSIVDNVGAYPPIIAANIQSIIRDGKDPDAELDKIAARNDFDINRLNAEWEEPNARTSPSVMMDDMDKPLRQPELMPGGWSVTWVGGKHWDVTDPSGRLARVTTDAEAYQHAAGRLEWWSGPRRHSARDDSEQGHNLVS